MHLFKSASFSPAPVSVVLSTGSELTPHKSTPDCIQKSCVTGNLMMGYAFFLEDYAQHKSLHKVKISTSTIFTLLLD